MGRQRPEAARSASYLDVMESCQSFTLRGLGKLLQGSLHSHTHVHVSTHPREIKEDVANLPISLSVLTMALMIKLLL